MTLIYNDNQSAGNSAKPPVTLRMLLPLWNFPCTPLLTELLPLLSVGFPDSSVSKESSFSAGDQSSIPDQEDSLEKETATHSSILAWRIPWTEEPGRLQSMGLQRVRHDWGTVTFTFHCVSWVSVGFSNRLRKKYYTCNFYKTFCSLLKILAYQVRFIHEFM